MFENGSEILRFDCHLHTVSDKEFKYDGESDKFISSYVDKLKSEGIGVGVITNHNKFDYEQYKALKKAANRRYIHFAGSRVIRKRRCKFSTYVS